MTLSDRLPKNPRTRLIVIALAVLMVCWIAAQLLSGTRTDTSSRVGSRPAPIEPVSLQPDLQPKSLDEQLSLVKSTSDRAAVEIQSQLNAVESLVASFLTGQVSPTELIASDFTGKGVDRTKFQSRFETPQIEVARWSDTKSAPSFEGKVAGFASLMKSMFEPWAGSDNFRIDLKLTSVKLEGDQATATLLANVYGDTSPESGRQATALWTTTWTDVDSTGTGLPPQLAAIEVLAQEEVVTHIRGGQLLQDCTASILHRCDAFRTQLRYGLDQWARRIPGIDITGQHGVAVGDINGDGFDDLFVCQPHGLPNLLLVQNPDGTAEDIAAAAQVDVLDCSHAALLVDLDNDGDQDLIVSTDENLLLFSNTNRGRFQLEQQLPIGRSAMSLSAADYDQDGDLDLFLCKFQSVRRRDDLIVMPNDFKKISDGGRNVLLRNDEGWHFTDATREAGITKRNNRFSRSAVWADYDRDGDQDLYVTNEFSNDQLYRNDKGWLNDVSDSVGLTQIARHRTVSCGDFNQDGFTDFFTATDVPFSAMRSFGKIDRDQKDDSRRDLRDTLSGESQIWYSRSNKKTLRPFAMRAPLFASESAFGSVAADLNNDGMDDIVVTNGALTRHSRQQVDEVLFNRLFPKEEATGRLESAVSPNPSHVAQVIRETTDLCRAGHSFSGQQRNCCYLSIGRLGFANFSAASGVDFAVDGRAVATTDWDNDGDADLVLTSRNGSRLRILCNQLDGNNNYLSLKLVGSESNADAIGARVEVIVGGDEQRSVKTVRAGSGNLSQSSKRLTFGLGKSDSIKKVSVVWPNGRQQDYSGFAANTSYQIFEGETDAAQQVAEVTPRLELNITPQPHAARQSLPSITRSLFYPPALLPELELIEPDEETYPALGPKPKSPTLLLVCDNQRPSTDLLNRVRQQVDSFVIENLDAITLVVDSSTPHSNTTLAFGQQAIGQEEFPLRWGVATAATIQRLELWSGNCFANQQLPPLPFGVLLNTEGQAVAFYPSDQIAEADFLSDQGLATKPGNEVWNQLMPTRGRWLAQHRIPVADRMAMRLAELGHDRTAAGLADASHTYRAYELSMKGLELMSAGTLPLAKSFFQKAIDTDDKFSLARFGMAEVLRKQAIEITTVDSQQEQEKQKLQLEAIAHYDYAIELDPLFTKAIVGRANVAIEQNQIDEAIKMLKRFVKVRPNDYQIHAIIGRLLFHKNDPAEAAQWLVEAFEKQPTLPYVAGDLGFLYLTVGEYREAMPFLELAHRLKPSDQNVHRLLAEGMYLNGDYRSCVAQCRQVLADDANLRRHTYLLAWLLATAPFEPVRDGAEAMKIMASPVKLFGDTSATTLEIYAACCAEQQSFDEAVKYQRRAIEMVREAKTMDTYTDAQLSGLRMRLKLYQRKKPCRMKNPAQTPLGVPAVLKQN